MAGNNVEYIKAYTEIKCLLRYFPIEYIKKLPNKLLEMIQKNSDEEYDIDVDLNKNLQDQNISKKTKDILAVLTYNYWSDKSEKEYLKNRFYENERTFQKELLEKYNTDNLFKNKKINEEKENLEVVSMVEYKKESLISKLLNKLKKFFKR